MVGAFPGDALHNFFFVQAEDGIRYADVTGVQTCALPIFTLNEHEPLAAMVPPDRLITLVFCVAVIVPAPQEPLRPLGVEMIRPAGSVSLKATPLSPTVVL